MKGALATTSPTVRRAAARQASDIVTPIYHLWKPELRAASITWPRFQEAASRNGRAWERWAEGEMNWSEAIYTLVDVLAAVAQNGAFHIEES
jgi:hypothetical protein